MYYVLQYEPFSDREALELARPSFPGRNDLSFDNGLFVDDPPELITFTMTSDERGDLGDYVPTGLPGLTISGRVRQALEVAGVDNVQYIPATIVDEVSNRTHDDFFVANVIGVVDCIDTARSKLTMRAAFPDKIRDIDELHIDQSRARDLLMFRLARRTTLVLVGESVKHVLAQANLRGVGVVPAEGFST